MKDKSPKDSVESAFDELEHVFIRYKSIAADESNRHPVGSPNRVEADFSELEKAHLDLLRAKLEKETAKKINQTLQSASESSDRLGTKVFWLNVVVAILTGVLAVSAIIELCQ